MAKRTFLQDGAKSGNADKAGKADGSTFHNQYRFIDGNLSAADREWLDNHRNDADQVIFDLVAGLLPKHKLSLSFDQKSSRFLATMACNDEQSPNHQCILNSRGETPHKALYALGYKFLVKFAGTAWGDGATASEWD